MLSLFLHFINLIPQHMQRDEQIFELIEAEKNRQLNGIELIASENFTSDQVMEATGSVLTNKYAEGYPGKRYYGGCEVVDEVEQIAIDRAKTLFGAVWANVQPHSGSQANTAVFHACLNLGDKILGFDLSHGGHLTHGSPVNFSGRLYDPVFYGVEKETGMLNYDKIQEIASTEQPKLIIAGASAYSRDIDYKRFREIADSVGAILLGDISHPSGLIAKGVLNDPLPHCHIVTTTTHKTLRGPRGGLIMMGKDFENPFGLKFVTFHNPFLDFFRQAQCSRNKPRITLSHCFYWIKRIKLIRILSYWHSVGCCRWRPAAHAACPAPICWRETDICHTGWSSLF